MGPMHRAPPLQYQEFMTLTARNKMCNLYLGRVPKDDAEREALNKKLFDSVQKNAPLMVDAISIARTRVDHIKKSYEWNDRGHYDTYKPITFVRGEARAGVQEPEQVIPQPFQKDEAMATSSSPSEPSASSDRSAMARAKWRAKTHAPAPLAIMPSTTALVGAGKGGHVDLADPAEAGAKRRAHLTDPRHIKSRYHV